MARRAAVKGRIRAGIGGWNYPPWRGVFYPAKLPHKRELEFASHALTTIEINGTYYSAFQPKDFARWREETPDDFMFALKASRYCTNRKSLPGAAESIQRFVSQGIDELGAKLGPVNWQFAAAKKFDAEEFGAFLKLLPREAGHVPLRHALEPRNVSFQCEAFYDLARRHQCAIVFADSDEFPQIDQPTGSFTYARLMRTEEQIETGYSETALDAWAKRARAWAKRGDVFIYFISGAKLRAPAAARALLSRLP